MSNYISESEGESSFSVYDSSYQQDQQQLQPQLKHYSQLQQYDEYPLQTSTIQQPSKSWDTPLKQETHITKEEVQNIIVEGIQKSDNENISNPCKKRKGQSTRLQRPQKRQSLNIRFPNRLQKFQKNFRQHLISKRNRQASQKFFKVIDEMKTRNKEEWIQVINIKKEHQTDFQLFKASLQNYCRYDKELKMIPERFEQILNFKNLNARKFIIFIEKMTALLDNKNQKNVDLLQEIIQKGKNLIDKIKTIQKDKKKMHKQINFTKTHIQILGCIGWINQIFDISLNEENRSFLCDDGNLSSDIDQYIAEQQKEIKYLKELDETSQKFIIYIYFKYHLDININQSVPIKQLFGDNKFIIQEINLDMVNSHSFFSQIFKYAYSIEIEEPNLFLEKSFSQFKELIQMIQQQKDQEIRKSEEENNKRLKQVIKNRSNNQQIQKYQRLNQQNYLQADLSIQKSRKKVCLEKH